MKIRGFYTRNKDLKFISHLNTVDLLQRAIFYTNAKIKFSEGFNVHPKMSFGNPLPLGVSSDFEVFDNISSAGLISFLLLSCMTFKEVLV